MTPSTQISTVGYIATIAFLTLLFASSVISYFGPIVMAGDAGQWSFIGHYFVENLSLFPVPRLALETDFTQYPYGANHAFLHWAFERDLLIGLGNRFLGPGPWLQFYFLGSLFTSAVGSFLAFRIIHKPQSAFFASLLIAFCNFYAISKFPGHLPHSCLHWTVIGIALDYVAVRLAVRDSALPLWIPATRVLLLVLCLGLELGYVAGYSLLSALLSYTWIGLLLAWRSRGHRVSVAALIPSTRTCIAQQIQSDRRRWALLGSALLLAGWFLVPLAHQVATEALSFDQPEFKYRRWSHPLRLLLPYFPALNGNAVGTTLLGDRAETAYDFRPGLTFVLAAGIGLVSGRHRIKVWGPFLLMLGLCVLFRPPDFPTLHAFPWFRYTRVPGRATMVFPVLLTVIALSGRPTGWRRRTKLIVTVALGSMLMVETVAAYSSLRSRGMKVLWHIAPEDDLWNLMGMIETSAGEAVFEWPFYVSGNPKTSTFGPLKGIYQLAAFHRKKAISVHLGRGIGRSASLLEEHGWPNLFFPSSIGGESRQQRRDFVEEEWEFITDFVRLNDFSGVLLYSDFLPDETVQGFYERFGEAQGRARIPSKIGAVEFIPKPPFMQGEEDPVRGREISLTRPVFVLPENGVLRMGTPQIQDFLRQGWRRATHQGRCTSGRQSAVAFRLDSPSPLSVVLRLLSTRNQSIIVELNDNRIATLTSSPKSRELEVEIPSRHVRLENELRLVFPDARQRKDRFGKADYFAICLSEILIRPRSF